MKTKLIAVFIIISTYGFAQLSQRIDTTPIVKYFIESKNHTCGIAGCPCNSFFRGLEKGDGRIQQPVVSDIIFKTEVGSSLNANHFLYSKPKEDFLHEFILPLLSEGLNQYLISKDKSGNGK